MLDMIVNGGKTVLDNTNWLVTVLASGIKKYHCRYTIEERGGALFCIARKGSGALLHSTHVEQTCDSALNVGLLVIWSMLFSWLSKPLRAKIDTFKLYA